jgi:hypothetical protein
MLYSDHNSVFISLTWSYQCVSPLNKRFFHLFHYGRVLTQVQARNLATELYRCRASMKHPYIFVAWPTVKVHKYSTPSI